MGRGMPHARITAFYSVAVVDYIAASISGRVESSQQFDTRLLLVVTREIVVCLSLVI